MLGVLGFKSLEQFISKVIPQEIHTNKQVDLNGTLTELDLTRELKEMASENMVYKSWIGAGYANCIVSFSYKTKCSRKSWMVYTVHPLSARNFTGKGLSLFLIFNNDL